MALLHFTDQNFKSEVLSATTPVLVDFWAEWCGPCRMLGPVVEKLAGRYAGKVKIGKLNVDDNPEVPQQYGIQGIPTVILFKNGQVISQMVGFQSEDSLVSALDSAL